VQGAFCGLFRRWPHLSDQAKSLPIILAWLAGFVVLAALSVRSTAEKI